LVSDVQIPTENTQGIWQKEGNMTPPKVNNCTVMDTNDREEADISESSKEWL
jgi:hypothetical protein